MQLFDRAPKGAEMMQAFKTIETRERVVEMQNDFSTIAVGQGALRLEIVPALERHGLSRADRRALPRPHAAQPHWIAILNDLTPMIGAMSDNVDNYQAISGLPAFGLFPWFFVIPGLLIAGLALLPVRRGAAWPRPRAPPPPFPHPAPLVRSRT